MPSTSFGRRIFGVSSVIVLTVAMSLASSVEASTTIAQSDAVVQSDSLITQSSEIVDLSEADSKVKNHAHHPKHHNSEKMLAQ